MPKLTKRETQEAREAAAQAAALLGSIRTPKKAAASRANGAKSKGRPRKKKGSPKKKA